MKRLIVVLMVLALAVPAMAQEKKATGPEWNFYGSARVYTFWGESDFAKDVQNAAGDRRDSGIQRFGDWGQSRIGARVKHGEVTGHFEVLLNQANGHDGNVTAKQIYGTWNFMDNGWFRVGKDYTPTSQFISRQVYNGDVGLLGFGTNYARRPFQLKLGLGGFQFALIEPPALNAYGGDADQWFPKMEASYRMKFDIFNFGVMGGFQTYKLDEPAAKPDGSEDLNSWIVGADVGLNIGAFFMNAAGSYGENWANARWSDLNNPGAGQGAFFDGRDLKDTTNWMAALVLGVKVTDAVIFEVGGGYRVNDADVSGSKDDEGWNAYAHATIGIAKNVYILPEVGYYQYDEDFAGDDEGHSWYAGARWQIDF